MKDALRAQFKDMQPLHQPRAEFVDALAARLETRAPQSATPEQFPAQIARVFETTMQTLIPARLVPVAQRLGTVLVIGVVAVGGWIGAVSASYNSVPGEALYNVKLATEKVQLAAVEATGDKTKTAKLHSEFAERRAGEVKRVIEKNKEPEQAKAAMALLTKSVNDANTAIKEAQADPNTSAEALVTTEELLADNERIAASLREVLDTLPANVSELIETIVVVHGDLTDKRLSTLQDIVRQQLEGTTNLTPEQTKEIVVRALKQISDTTNEAVALAKELEAREQQVDLDTTSEPVPTTTTTTPSVSTTLAAPTTTDIASTSVTTTADPVVTTTPIAEAVQLSDIDGLSADVQAEIKTVESLINDGNLLEALETAKSINSKQIEIEQVVKKAALETGTVAPEVPVETEELPPASSSTDTITTSSTNEDSAPLEQSSTSTETAA